jgi:hypothetical protein
MIPSCVTWSFHLHWGKGLFPKITLPQNTQKTTYRWGTNNACGESLQAHDIALIVPGILKAHWDIWQIQSRLILHDGYHLHYFFYVFK